MTIPAEPGAISWADLNDEVGGSVVPLSAANLLNYINPCANPKPDENAPYAASEWWSYDGATIPPAPTVTIHPGNVADQRGNTYQPLDIFISWSVVCDGLDENFGYFIYASTSSGGTYNLIGKTVPPTTELAWNVQGAGSTTGTSRFVKVKATSSGTEGDFSAETEGRTTPTYPQNVHFDASLSDPSDAWKWCNKTGVTVYWSNGTPPGERLSKIVYQGRAASWSGPFTSSTYGDSSVYFSWGTPLTNGQDVRIEMVWYEQGGWYNPNYGYVVSVAADCTGATTTEPPTGTTTTGAPTTTTTGAPTTTTTEPPPCYSTTISVAEPEYASEALVCASGVSPTATYYVTADNYVYTLITCSDPPAQGYYKTSGENYYYVNNYGQVSGPTACPAGTTTTTAAPTTTTTGAPTTTTTTVLPLYIMGNDASSPEVACAAGVDNIYSNCWPTLSAATTCYLYWDAALTIPVGQGYWADNTYPYNIWYTNGSGYITSTPGTCT